LAVGCPTSPSAPVNAAIAWDIEAPSVPKTIGWSVIVAPWSGKGAAENITRRSSASIGTLHAVIQSSDVRGAQQQMPFCR